ncbi:hypothetical protein DFH09DRAFT_1086251 [Mycena vulgaris]|nr:hypothetical protein DFH09DRAFT_1086251 [Mycena vulgaris]
MYMQEGCKRRKDKRKRKSTRRMMQEAGKFKEAPRRILDHEPHRRVLARIGEEGRREEREPRNDAPCTPNNNAPGSLERHDREAHTRCPPWTCARAQERHEVSAGEEVSRRSWGGREMRLQGKEEIHNSQKEDPVLRRVEACVRSLSVSAKVFENEARASEIQELASVRMPTLEPAQLPATQPEPPPPRGTLCRPTTITGTTVCGRAGASTAALGVEEEGAGVEEEGAGVGASSDAGVGDSDSDSDAAAPPPIAEVVTAPGADDANPAPAPGPRPRHGADDGGEAVEAPPVERAGGCWVYSGCEGGSGGSEACGRGRGRGQSGRGGCRSGGREELLIRSVGASPSVEGSTTPTASAARSSVCKSRRKGSNEPSAGSSPSSPCAALSPSTPATPPPAPPSAFAPADLEPEVAAAEFGVDVAATASPRRHAPPAPAPAPSPSPRLKARAISASIAARSLCGVARGGAVDADAGKPGARAPDAEAEGKGKVVAGEGTEADVRREAAVAWAATLSERECVIGDKRDSIGRQSSLARPVRDRARAGLGEKQNKM